MILFISLFLFLPPTLSHVKIMVSVLRYNFILTLFDMKNPMGISTQNYNFNKLVYLVIV